MRRGLRILVSMVLILICTGAAIAARPTKALVSTGANTTYVNQPLQQVDITGLFWGR